MAKYPTLSQRYASAMLPARLVPMIALASLAHAAGWPEEVQKIEHPATSDSTMQPAMFYAPPTAGEAVPLLVGLHTWSGDYTQAANGGAYARWCIERGWAFIYPNFRGANRTPAAMGSDLAVQDVVDAVAWARQNANVDETRIYLIGVSGGGHMSLLMAGRHPEIWAGVSAWCGISDIYAWHTEHLKEGKPDNYARMIEAALGGPPRPGTPELADAMKRSPVSWLARAADVPLDINHGIHDGRSGSVPFRHSLIAFNKVVGAASAIPDETISQFYQSQKPPAEAPAFEADTLYGVKVVRYRNTSGNTRVTIFEGGHEMIYLAGLNWLAAQRKGQAAVWKIDSPVEIDLGDGESGK